MALNGKPPGTEEEAGFDRCHIARAECRTAIVGHVKRAFARVDANQVRAAVFELIFDGPLDGHLVHGVVTIDAVHAVAIELLPAQKFRQFARDQDVDVSGQYETSPGAPDPDVLGDHLVERQGLSVVVAGVEFRGNFYEPDFAWTEVVGPAQGIDQCRTCRRRIPLHDDQFRRDLIAAGLFDPAADEGLHAAQEIATMIVIPGGDDQRQVRFHGAGHYAFIAASPSGRDASRRDVRGRGTGTSASNGNTRPSCSGIARIPESRKRKCGLPSRW